MSRPLPDLKEAEQILKQQKARFKRLLRQSRAVEKLEAAVLTKCSQLSNIELPVPAVTPAIPPPDAVAAFDDDDESPSKVARTEPSTPA